MQEAANEDENSDADAQRDGRRETPSERSDRNWVDILQELRVTQTGTQILTGFLLTLAFQPRFADLNNFQLVTYLVLVCLAAATTVLGLAPVSLHRALFGRREKVRVVMIGDRILRGTLVAVALLVIGVVFFIFDVVVGNVAAIVAAAITLAFVVACWLLVPLGLRLRNS